MFLALDFVAGVWGLLLSRGGRLTRGRGDMISSDPQKRAQRKTEILELLPRSSAPEEREVLLAFGAVDLDETPDRIMLRLAPDALAERVRGHFSFIVQTIPPSIQLYRGLPGIHVAVHHPGGAEAEATGAGRGLPLEMTVVETHTPDIPFIFDSLKNYFAKAGLRVFSAVHPIFTVRRQCERVAWIGGPHEEGSREVYCNFQIEPVDSQERRHRMEHEIFSLLKCVFLAAEDFPAMLHKTAGLTARLRSHPSRPGDAETARAFLEWLSAENYIFLGVAHYTAGADGQLEQVRDDVSGVFRDPSLLPVVFPGFLEGVEAHLRPGEQDRRVEVNIKILLDMLLKQRVIAGREERNQLLADMTEDVARLVLKDNEQQARALTLDGLRSASRYEEFLGFIDELETNGFLNRADERVPSREALRSRLKL